PQLHRISSLFPYTTLFRSKALLLGDIAIARTSVDQLFLGRSEFLFFGRSLKSHSSTVVPLRLASVLPSWEIANKFPSPSVARSRSEEHTSELQSPCNLVCR